MRTPTSHPGLAGWMQQRLGAQEFRRRLWHFFPGVLAFALTPIPHRDPIPLGVMLIIISLGIVVPAILAARYHRFYRRHPEEGSVAIILGYAIPLSVLALICRGQTEIPLAVATIIAFGDGSATLVGLLWRGAKVPWNPRKSWAGLFAFMIFGTLAASSIYWLEAMPQPSFQMAFLCMAPVVVLCAIVETLPLPINDNVSVGVSAAVLTLISQSLTIGWA